MSYSNGTCLGRRRVSNDNCKNYIEHQVSKLDTLAGVAIKYGVEVADIKRLNGLATDLQMFGLNILRIPLPGRHPPSPIVSDGSVSPTPRENSVEKPPLGQSRNGLESLQSLRLSPPRKVSAAMSTLQKYYALRSSNHKGAAEGTEMANYRRMSFDNFENGHSTPNGFNKFRNSSSGSLPENGLVSELASFMDGESEKCVRRRSKDSTPEKLLKEEKSGGGNSWFSPLLAKGLAMRPKSASRTVTANDSDSGFLNLVGMGDSIADGWVGVRKSSSASSLQDRENSNTSSLWPTSRWCLKPDLQALTAAAITRPIFDGLPKPMAGKTALD